MKVSIKKQRDYQISKWSGGTTTQLYIYPEDGDYAARKFQVRISSATVEDEVSQFTSLPGVKRFLMTLNGKLRLVHKDQYEKTLRPGQVEKFPGDWETTSYGKVRDFNLMLKDGAKGLMEYEELKPGDLWVLPLCQNQNKKVILYVIDGSLAIKGKPIETGELAVIEDFQTEQCVMENQGIVPAKLAVCRITV